MGKLDGKIALVTGATGGIGRATAERFLTEGAKVWLVDREEGPLSDLASHYEGRAGWSAGDIADEATMKAAVAACVAKFGGLDVLFANAGIEGHIKPLLDTSVEEFDGVLNVNVRGTWLSIKHAAPAIAARGGGSIVITSSIAGLIGSSGLGPYVTSKHAVIGLMKTAALELAPLGIRVNAVNPGPIDNRMMRSIEEQAAPGAAEAVKAGFTAQVPLKRYGRNDEIASVALFLASNESSYCTGGCFVADGGFVIG